jgi:hypothetical protein
MGAASIVKLACKVLLSPIFLVYTIGGLPENKTSMALFEKIHSQHTANAYTTLSHDLHVGSCRILKR